MTKEVSRKVEQIFTENVSCDVSNVKLQLLLLPGNDNQLTIHCVRFNLRDKCKQ